MNKKIAKYFWDLNGRALKETWRILEKPGDARFASKMVTFLSRCDNPKEVFSVVPKESFIHSWPAIKSYWLRAERGSEYRDWWQTLYEQLLEKTRFKKASPKGEASDLFKRVGLLIKKARVEKGLSQAELSILTGIKQPEISKIEEGGKNITLATLARFCKALGIAHIKIDKRRGR